MVILVVATAVVTFFDNKLGATPREGDSHIKRRGGDLRGFYFKRG